MHRWWEGAGYAVVRGAGAAERVRDGGGDPVAAVSPEPTPDPDRGGGPHGRGGLEGGVGELRDGPPVVADRCVLGDREGIGEDPGGILAAAERASGFGTDAAEGPITVDVEAIRDSVDPRLAPVRRWFGMRLQAGGARLAVRTITLDFGALAALAELMGVSAVECRRILAQAGIIPQDGPDTGTSSYPPAAVG